MRRRPWLALAALGAGLALALAAPLDAARGAPSAATGSGAAGDGLVRVLVGLDAPEELIRGHGSASPSARAARRTHIAAARGALGLALRGTRHRELRAYRDLPLVALEVDAAGLARLARDPRVRHVEPDRLLRPSLSSTVPLVQGDAVHASGPQGAGWTVAIIDTGIDVGHPFLAGRVVAEACFSAGGDCPDPPGATSQIGPGAGVHCTWADRCAHGTHVAGIAASADGTLTGMAPQASILSIRVFSRFTGTACAPEGEDPCALVFLSDLVAALDHVVGLRDSLSIAAVNLSIVGDTYPSQAACDTANPGAKLAIDMLRDAGIPTIAAAGNQGLTSEIAEPACISSAVAVGATTDADQIWSSSNSASFLSLLAPGASVLSATPPSLPGFGSTGIMSGTSMATPHVAGALALLRAVAPTATAAALVESLRSTGLPITDTNGITTPRIRVFDAYQLLLGPDCADGLDNDGDGLVDHPADPGCGSANQFTEAPACNDGLDNDLDGLVDWDGAGIAPPDPGCFDGSDRSEGSGRACGLGFELVGVLWGLSAWRVRRRGRRPGGRPGGDRAAA